MLNKTQFLVALFLLAAAVPAAGSSVQIGGPGAVSTSDEPYGSLGLLDQGEVATAIVCFVVTPTVGGAELTMTVVNTSPAVLGTESPLVPDAPVLVDILFSMPSVVETVELTIAGGQPASISGWEFTFDPDQAPSTGYGFLKSTFDGFVDGGPGSGSPDPVIASVFDPDMTDEPGTPYPSPQDFVFALTFEGGTYPSGFSGDWFCDPVILGSPDYVAAAKFISAADGGSGTVTTTTIPAPGALALGMVGMGLVGLVKRLRARTPEDGKRQPQEQEQLTC